MIEPDKTTLKCKVNGQPVKAEIPSNMTLLTFIRETLKLTGTKEGCGEGECGACTVLINSKPVNSCLIPAVQAEGAEIITIEGLQDEKGGLHPIQKSFIENGAVQCGFCIPGMVLTSKALLDKNSDPTREEIKNYLAGNLCRCTGYIKIFEAVEEAAKTLRK